MTAEAPPLEYANGPVHGNLVATRRPGSVTISILPFRPMVRTAVVRLIVAVLSSVVLFLVLYTSYRGGSATARATPLAAMALAGLGAVLPISFIIDATWRLAMALSPAEFEADGTGLRYTKWVVRPGGWRVFSRTTLPRERIEAVAACRTPKRSRKKGAYVLEIRLTAGVRVRQGFGTKEEIRWLVALLSEAMEIRPS